MSQVYAIRLSGSGGQGLILAGIILAEAAGLHEGHFVAQSQSYGPEARGGNSMAEVIMSDAPIAFPKAVKLDFLVALSQQAAKANRPDLKEGGLYLFDPDLVNQPPGPGVVQVPCTRLAFKVAKAQIAANMVALGAVAALCPWVGPASLRKAIKNRLPAKILDMNLKAFKAGLKEAEQYLAEADVA